MSRLRSGWVELVSAVAVAWFCAANLGCRKTGDETVLARIDGTAVTARTVKDAALIRFRIDEIKKKKPLKLGPWANRAAMKYTPSIVFSVAWEKDLDAKGFVATAASDAQTLQNYNKTLNGKYANLDELAKEFGELEPVFRAQFARESKFNAFYASCEELKVGDKDVDRYYSSLSNRNDRCRAINEEANRKITAAWQRLNARESWESVATNVTEDALLEPTYANNWRDWMSLSVNKIEPPELAVLVKNLKVGEYSAPFDHSEGMIIVRVVDLDGEFVSLARILVRAAEVKDIPPREIAEKRVYAEKMQAFQGETIDGLRQRMKFEYPLGEKFDYEIWPEYPLKKPKAKKVPRPKKEKGKKPGRDDRAVQG